MPTNTSDRLFVPLLLAALVVVLVVPLFFMGFGMMGYGGMMGEWGGMWGDGRATGWLFAIALLVRLLFLAAIVGGIYLLYRALTESDDGADAALDELRLAYARGDLSEEEYESRRETLDRER